ncbi:MAG: hypothetical protein HY647_06275 [Acidobacteria bacterium]|nr:hypothetical protein [Acidobacteriota bacterium]
MVARGRAVSVDQHAIPLLEEEDIRGERRCRAEARAEEQYWCGVAAQHGGDDVAFIWQSTSVPAYPGASRELGYRVMGAQMIATPRNPQPARGAIESLQFFSGRNRLVAQARQRF